jgi:uncharacterized protein
MTTSHSNHTGATLGAGERIALGMIRWYQNVISPSLGTRCRYAPSCSHYAAEAIETHGLGRGTWLAVRRLARCRPGGGSGFDEVPSRDVVADEQRS